MFKNNKLEGSKEMMPFNSKRTYLKNLIIIFFILLFSTIILCLDELDLGELSNNKEVQGKYREVIDLIKLDKYDQAIEMISNVLKENSSNTPLIIAGKYYQVFDLECKATSYKDKENRRKYFNESKDVLTELQEIVLKQPDSDKKGIYKRLNEELIPFQMVVVHKLLGDVDTAINLAQKIIEEDPDRDISEETVRQFYFCLKKKNKEESIKKLKEFKRNYHKTKTGEMALGLLGGQAIEDGNDKEYSSILDEFEKDYKNSPLIKQLKEYKELKDKQAERNPDVPLSNKY